MRAGQRAGQYSDYFLLGLLLTPPKVFPKLNPNLQLATCNLAVQRAGQRAGQYSAYFLLDYFLLPPKYFPNLIQTYNLQLATWLDRGLDSTRPTSYSTTSYSRGLDRGLDREGAGQRACPAEGWTEGRAGLDSCLARAGQRGLSRGCPEAVQRLSRGCNSV